MATYFHVDRRARFRAGLEIDLIKPDLSATPDLSQHMNLLFPAGVSQHGLQYLNVDVKAGNGEPAIELLWEYVRRAHFPDRPLRFIESLEQVLSGRMHFLQAKHDGPRLVHSVPRPARAASR
ncbi:hypothetical protein DBA20_15860 [Pandoraea capi]|nr:hypothetical protein [Pandoraea sp. LA3]MDN4584463.1 hypothetical protein [Pandoraea capi]